MMDCLRWRVLLMRRLRRRGMRRTGAFHPLFSSHHLAEMDLLVAAHRPPYTLMIWVQDSTDAVSVETTFRVAVEQCGFVPTAFKVRLSSPLLVSPFFICSSD
jgi:hypothetical protein